MTVSIAFLTVVDSISKLSISGVTNKDADTILASYLGQAAIFAPRPNGFISGVNFDVDSFGPGNTRKGTLKYILTYTYFHCAIGSTLDFASYYAALTNIVAILNAILTNQNVTGCVDLSLRDVSTLGAVSDPVGNQFHGCEIALDIKEFIN